MTPQTRRFLDRLLVDSCAELFATYGVSVERKSASSEDATALLDQASGGIVRFSGEAVNGSLFVVGTFDFLAACRPETVRRQTLAMSSVADWIFVRDWSMELTNQLLGRVRNKLYAYGVSLEVRSPTAVSGHPLAVSIRGRASEPLRFVTKGGETLMVWLDVVAAAPFEAIVTNKRDPSPVIPKEGDVVVF